MYKIPDEVIQFIKKTMETWRVELTAVGKSLAEVKFQRGIFPEDTLSPLPSVIVLMPLNHILRKWTAVYKLNKLQDQPLHVHGRHLFSKNEKKLENLMQTVRISSQDI